MLRVHMVRYYRLSKCETRETWSCLIHQQKILMRCYQYMTKIPSKYGIDSIDHSSIFSAKQIFQKTTSFYIHYKWRIDIQVGVRKTCNV